MGGGGLGDGNLGEGLSALPAGGFRSHPLPPCNLSSLNPDAWARPLIPGAQRPLDLSLLVSDSWRGSSSITVNGPECYFRATCSARPPANLSDIWRIGGFILLQLSQHEQTYAEQRNEHGRRRLAPSLTFPKGTFDKHDARFNAPLSTAPLSKHPTLPNLEVTGSGRRTLIDLTVKLSRLLA